MQVIAHRGQWFSPEDKNSREALCRAFQAGYGVETDIRDLAGKLVVSHDMPKGDALPLNVMLEDYHRAGGTGTLALNIKSDGLTDALNSLLNEYEIRRYFCFDMSVPDTLPYLRAEMNAAARLSEYEPEGPLSKQASFYWVDNFHNLILDMNLLEDWMHSGKQVCLVSPELHGYGHHAYWKTLASLPKDLLAKDELMLCTDFAEQAREYFA